MKFEKLLMRVFGVGFSVIFILIWFLDSLIIALISFGTVALMVLFTYWISSFVDEEEDVELNKDVQK